MYPPRDAESEAAVAVAEVSFGTPVRDCEAFGAACGVVSVGPSAVQLANTAQASTAATEAILFIMGL